VRQVATAAAVALYVIHRAGAQHIDRRLKVAPTGFDLWPNSHTQPWSAIFNGLHPLIHVITWITIHLPIPKGWKA